jgi:hypothetical protein
VLLEEVRRGWDEPGQWPTLPRDAVLGLTRDAVHVIQKGKGGTLKQDSESVIQERLDDLRRRLRDRFDFVVGVAFAQEPEEPADQ